ncbi:MAG: hypothetical protein M0R37_07760 [Bacteroidales bacterium]|nr:hypothetical protein [Bacteroidales bacterium]
MEPAKAFELLIARAKERTGIRVETRLARHLDLAQENYISEWRGRLRDDDSQGPSFKNIVPLLEAAGVFSDEQDAARDDAAAVRKRATEEEAKTSERDLRHNGRRQHPGEAQG